MFYLLILYIYILHIYFLCYTFGGFNVRFKNKFLYLFYGEASGRYLVKPCNFPHPIHPVCQDPSEEPSYPPVYQHSHACWHHVWTDRRVSQSLHQNHWTEILNKNRFNTNPWGTPLVTGHQLDLVP